MSEHDQEVVSDAKALQEIAKALRQLGINHGDPLKMGAVTHLAKTIQRAAKVQADAIVKAAELQQESAQWIASAITDLANAVNGKRR